MLLLGFSAGLPLLLIFSSLSLWLREAGLERSAVTYCSWAALGYSFKFVWAPLVGRVPLPGLRNLLGQRRSWLLLSQLSIAAAICLMALTDPSSSDTALQIMAFAAVLLGFSSATQDIVIDAYRIEFGDKTMQAMLSSMYVAGYRVGMIAAGAGALFLADYFGTRPDHYSYVAWRNSYLIMAGCMSVGIATTLAIREPEILKRQREEFRQLDYARLFATFLLAVAVFIMVFYSSSATAQYLKDSLAALLLNTALAAFVVEMLRLALATSLAFVAAHSAAAVGLVPRALVDESYIKPITDFFRRYSREEVLLVLLLISLYRISDIVLGVISNVFYQDMGYSKTEIAAVVKTFGLVMTILGGFIGGVLAIRYGVIKTLFLGAVLTVGTNLLFLLLSVSEPTLVMLYAVISADNLAAGLASAAFIAFLSNLVNVSFTAMQYAIFSSLMTLFPKIIGGYSGSMVDNLGYPLFFIFAAAIGLPVLWVIHKLGGHMVFREDEA